MRWEKIGLVYTPSGLGDWAKHTATIPTPVMLNNGTLRIFTSFIDGNGCGRPAFVDVDPDNVQRVIRVSREPLIDVGEPGSFDDNGALACSVVQVDDRHLFMYYVGFEICTQVRYRLFTGLAISEDGGDSFRKFSSTPILDRTDAERLFRCGPYVMKQDGTFRMWYIAGSEWTEVNGKAMPHYVLKYMESEDGINWPREGCLSMDVSSDDEHGFGRPWVVVKPNGLHQMFYSIRRRSMGAYRLGYAESRDGLAWERNDPAMGLGVSPGSFDSKMIAYSAVIDVGSNTYCFYNGNQFGKDGFAVAKLIDT